MQPLLNKHQITQQCNRYSTNTRLLNIFFVFCFFRIWNSYSGQSARTAFSSSILVWISSRASSTMWFWQRWMEERTWHALSKVGSQTLKASYLATQSRQFFESCDWSPRRKRREKESLSSTVTALPLEVVLAMWKQTSRIAFFKSINLRKEDGSWSSLRHKSPKTLSTKVGKSGWFIVQDGGGRFVFLCRGLNFANEMGLWVERDKFHSNAKHCVWESCWAAMCMFE